MSIAEAANLGEKFGMDPKMLCKIMSVSSARCWSVDTYNPVPGVLENVPSSRDYNNGFACKLMLKDLKIAMESAKQVGSYTRLGTNSTEVF
jgi:3-hydroxyisobutyrate dehydrogenase